MSRLAAVIGCVMAVSAAAALADEAAAGTPGESRPSPAGGADPAAGVLAQAEPAGADREGAAGESAGESAEDLAEDPASPDADGGTEARPLPEVPQSSPFPDDSEPSPEPSGDAAADTSAADGEGQADPTPQDPLPGEQELGASLGLALGGGSTPGGLRIGGRYYYRLSSRDWFDAGVGFTFGSSREACFRDRRDDVVCDHGFASGFAAEVRAGGIRFFGSDDTFSPYARLGVAGRIIAFPGDEVRGIAAPAFVGAGVRARVHDFVAVTGGAEFLSGPAWMSRGMGLEPHASFAVSAGVEFTVVD